MPPALCSNECNAQLAAEGGTTTGPVDFSFDGVCNDGGPGDPAPFAALCSFGTDCDDCGGRNFCHLCPEQCQYRSFQTPQHGCMQSMWDDGKCDKECNNKECGFNDCSAEQATETCLAETEGLGEDLSVPPSRDIVELHITRVSSPSIEINIDLNTIVYTVTLGYTMQWTDERLERTPCLPILPTLLSLFDGLDELQFIQKTELRHKFFVPEVVVMNSAFGPSSDTLGSSLFGFMQGTQDPLARRELDSDDATASSTANTTASRIFHVAQDWKFFFFPFDSHDIVMKLHVPDVHISSCSSDQIGRDLEAIGGLIPDGRGWSKYGSVTAAHEEASSGEICILRVPVRRDSLVYTVRSILTFVIVVQAALLAMWLNPLAPPLVGARSGLLITAMVGLSIRSNIDYGLGRIDYFVWADIFALLQFFVVCLALLETIYVHQLAISQQQAKAMSVDRVARVLVPLFIYPVLVIAMLVMGIAESIVVGVAIAVGGLLVFVILGLLKVQYELTMRKRRMRQLMVELLSLDLQAPEAEARVEDAFNFLDLSGDGYLGQRELRPILRSLNPKLTRKQAAAILKSLDANQDGKVGVGEFWRLLECVKDEGIPVDVLPTSRVMGINDADESPGQQRRLSLDDRLRGRTDRL